MVQTTAEAESNLRLTSHEQFGCPQRRTNFEPLCFVHTAEDRIVTWAKVEPPTLRMTLSAAEPGDGVDVFLRVEQGQFFACGLPGRQNPGARQIKRTICREQLICALQTLRFQGMGFSVASSPQFF